MTDDRRSLGSGGGVLLGAGVVKRSAVLADGRELIFYDDPGTALTPERCPDARRLTARPDTGTMRRDPLTGEWIAYATHRADRVVMPGADSDPLAPQTPDNPSEVPSPYDVVVFENRSPAFGPAFGRAGDSAGDPTTEHRLGLSRRSIGRCEVVCFSPEPSGSFGTQSVTRARTVIEAWADRTAALSALPGVEQVFPFENRGAEIGVTLPHPHGQIYAYPYVTPRTRTLLDRISETGDDLMARNLAFEQGSDRVVLRGDHWTAYVPFAARWPVEVHLVPHRHVPDFTALNSVERDELAPLYLRLLRGVDALYHSPTPYIAAWHQAPASVGRDVVRMHLELTSPRRAADKTKFVAGSEAAMGAWTAEILPEDSAYRLRTAVESVPDAR